jgi:uncharacterized protein YkwD
MIARMMPTPLRSFRNYSGPLWLLLLLLSLHARAAQERSADTQPAFAASTEQSVLALTNAFRAESGLQALEAEPRLADAARSFAGYLASTGKLDHDADGTTPPERVKKRGYEYCIVAENLASEYSSAGFTPDALAQNVVQGWRASPTHRDNMLQADVTQIGVGVARSPKDGEYFAVQVFARPMSQMVRFRVSNRANATVRYEYRKRMVTLAPKQSRNHETCVAGDLRLDTGGQNVALRPKNGGRYAIVGSGSGGFRLQEE